MREAEQYAAEDKKRKEEVDTKNEAESLVYQSEKALADMGDKLDAADKRNVEDAIAKVKNALSGQDTASIKAASEELQKAFYAVSEKLYQQQAPGGGAGFNPGAQGGAPGGDNGGSGDYYDADYTVVDDDDKK